jgi:hypothetical protein
MNQSVPDEADPRERITRLEQRIDELSLKLEACRKYSLAARSAIGLGAVLLFAKLFAIIHLDPVTVTAAGAAVLGGIVLAGSNRSTARELEAELRQAEGERAALIGQIELRVVEARNTVH